MKSIKRRGKLSKKRPTRDRTEYPRLSIAQLSTIYDELLTLDAWLSGNAKATQARSLLQAKLNEKEGRIRERIALLASRRGVSPEEMVRLIKEGSANDSHIDEE